jgi:hypothetical protein
VDYDNAPEKGIFELFAAWNASCRNAQVRMEGNSYSRQYGHVDPINENSKRILIWAGRTTAGVEKD